MTALGLSSACRQTATQLFTWRSRQKAAADEELKDCLLGFVLFFKGDFPGLLQLIRSTHIPKETKMQFKTMDLQFGMGAKTPANGAKPWAAA